MQSLQTNDHAMRENRAEQNGSARMSYAPLRLQMHPNALRSTVLSAMPSGQVIRLSTESANLTGPLTVSDGFLTGRTLTKPLSTLAPDGLTAPDPQEGIPGSYSLPRRQPGGQLCRATRYDTLRHASLSVSSVASGKISLASARPRKPRQAFASQN